MTEPLNSRYAELKRVVEILTQIDVNAKNLPVIVGELRREAEKALVFKQSPRNCDMEAARAASKASNRVKADAFAASIAPAIAAAREGGASTVREIAEALNRAGVLTSRGRTWSSGTLHRFLDDG
jgi:hypothetical protein